MCRKRVQVEPEVPSQIEDVLLGGMQDLGAARVVEQVAHGAGLLATPAIDQVGLVPVDTWMRQHLWK